MSDQLLHFLIYKTFLPEILFVIFLVIWPAITIYLIIKDFINKKERQIAYRVFCPLLFIGELLS